MRTLDLIERGHQLVLSAVEGLSAADADVPGACGRWSIREIVAHLASYEALTVEVLAHLDSDATGRLVTGWLDDRAAFNHFQLNRLGAHSLDRLLASYRAHHEVVLNDYLRIPDARLRRTRGLAWYGAHRPVYAFLIDIAYKHKRAHALQIVTHRRRLLDRPRPLKLA
jgi:hypothetical protein